MELPPKTGVTVAMWLKGVGAFQPKDQVLFISQDPAQPIVVSVGLRDGYPSFEVSDGANAYAVTGDRRLRNDDWVHLACTYQQDTHVIALLVDGVPLYGGPQDGTGPRSTIAASGPAVSGKGMDVAYTVGGVGPQESFVGLINELSLWNRALSVAEARQKINLPLSASERGLAGYWPFNDLFGTTVMDRAGTANGVLTGGDFTRVDKGQFAHKVFVDGIMEAFERVVDPLVVSDTHLTIGSAEFSGYLQGTVGETRLWTAGRMNWQVAYFARRDPEPNPRGLISRWPLETGRNAVAFDDVSDNDAVIRDAGARLTAAAVDAMWVRATFMAAWTFYLDGVAVPATTFAIASEEQVFGDPQATIAVLSYQSALVNEFTGDLAELRVWDRQLTGEQVRGLLHRPLHGDEPGLAGYWPFDDGSGEIIADRTSRGANGQWIGGGDPAWGPSSVPVALEPLAVTSLPGGIAGDHSRRSAWAPGTAAYGRLEQGARGELLATLKLAFGSIDADADADAAGAGRLELRAGDTLGALDIAYVGQAQMAPTLIGYIEGAPPLPAENLKVFPDSPDSYVAASSVTIDEVGNEVLTYTGSRTIGSDSALSLQEGLGIELNTSAGIGVQQQIYGMELSAGLQTESEESAGTLAEAQVSEETQATARKYLESQGAWHPNTYAIDGGTGSVFYPSNVGYALVRSGTADVFAMRIRGSGTLVGYSMRPSPDIPEDMNIIMFKIKDTYVKNGTLDGWIGFQPDSGYGHLQPGEHGSYFKPLEAYALKRLVDRERQQRRTRFEAFDASGLGRRDKAGRPGAVDLSEPDRDIANVLLGVTDKNALTGEEWKERMARRNMVNTYVWTSEGGLYSEEQQYTAVREESSGGVYSMAARIGGYAELSFNVGPSYSLSALFGTHVTTQAMKARREQWQYLMEAQVLGERYTGLIEEGEDDLVYTDKPSPGKVQAYRFMSFYLAPSKRNFDDFPQVVDDEWLAGTGRYAGSYDPDALALRQALTRPNEVWRLLHRVTYVSRTPPPTQGEGESLPSQARRPDEESIAQNARLISELPPTTDRAGTLARVSVEADALLTVLAENPVWGPKLTAVRAAVKRDLMTYMGSFYGFANDI
ncbi:LamG-like jellyroll fold domain-containing protein [Actinocorallia longicatena]|uniref:LamG-like jellyroll fold domain-containing protein n=1 Tax=Actinocorallia longicatena TaxID=111803 RepID=A0ABP6QBY0_9ACTN